MTAEAQAARRRRWGRFGWRRWLPQAVFESVLIVLSLVLALAMSRWVEDRRTAERVEEARGFFAEEIALNCRRLAAPDSMQFHRRLLSEVAAAVEAGEPAKAEAAAFRRGVRPTLFRDAVWRSLSSGELLESMEPREVFALASLYKLQEQLSQVNNGMQVTVMQATAQADPAREAAGGLAKSLRLYFGDVTAIEDEIMRMYPEMLRLLDADAAAEACRQAAARSRAAS